MKKAKSKPCATCAKVRRGFRKLRDRMARVKERH